MTVRHAGQLHDRTAPRAAGRRPDGSRKGDPTMRWKRDGFGGWAPLRVTLCLLGSALLVGGLPTGSLAAPGQLDPGFDGDGRVSTDFGGKDAGFAMVVQRDGKIVAAGITTANDGGDFALARYRANGTLDPRFDGDGRVTTDFGGDDEVFTLTVQRDGKIVAAGITPGTNGDDFALARYNPDGSLDASFDGDGKVTTDFGGIDQPQGIAVQRDGRIVVAGLSFGANGGDSVLARYNPNGSLDASFDGDGKVTTDFGGSDELLGLALQRDGKLVAAGDAAPAGDSDSLVARYNTDGSLDASFDGDGKVFTDFGGDEQAFDVALQRDGKIVAAGLTTTANNSDFAVARYNANGSLDDTFNGDGRVVTDFGGDEVANAVAIQQDGKIVAAGEFDTGTRDFAVARYRANGSLDTSFDGDGRVVTDFGGDDEGAALALKGRRKIVVAGQSDAAGGEDFALARYRGQ
jgi:uncharacterized delta-60 repeat protein